MLSAYLVHALPGRARIRIPAKRGNQSYFRDLESALGRCADVTSVQVNPTAASALIVYPPAADLQTIANCARERQLFDLKPAVDSPPAQSIGETAASQLDFLDRLLATSSRGNMDLRSAVFLLLIALAMRQIWRGHVMQPAVALLWDAFELLRDPGKRL
jgi:hypothetical protein